MRAHCLIGMLTATLFSVIAAGETPFDAKFEDATLRIDFYHAGSADQEYLTFDRLIRQGVWAGSRTRLVDPFKYGGYLVEARDAESGTLLFSQGFDSYFGEYRTTEKALGGEMRTYHESVLLPFPKRPLTVEFTARRRDGTTVPLGAITVDPTSPDIGSEPPASTVDVMEIHKGGAPHETLDIAIIGEGYTAKEKELFRKDVSRAAKTFLEFEPYASYKERISVRGVFAPSPDRGCDEPTRGLYRDTALGVTFNSLGSERYVLTESNRRLRDVAANVPYDAIIIMINHDRYGGGGIYNLFCTFTAHSQWADYLLLHEFGHSFAGLADEYYSSSTAYNDFYPRGEEPVEPNITALLDPEQLKWKDLVDPATELPTPWEKEAYDNADTTYQLERRKLNEAIAKAVRSGASGQEIGGLKRKETEHADAHAKWARAYLANSAFAGVVGAYEGAGYSATGLYRPELDCLMFSRRVQPYCSVCERSVEAMIERFSE